METYNWLSVIVGIILGLGNLGWIISYRKSSGVEKELKGLNDVLHNHITKVTSTLVKIEEHLEGQEKEIKAILDSHDKRIERIEDLMNSKKFV